MRLSTSIYMRVCVSDGWSDGRMVYSPFLDRGALVHHDIWFHHIWGNALSFFLFLFFSETYWGSPTLTLLNVLGVLGVPNVLNMPMDASLACWALFS